MQNPSSRAPLDVEQEYRAIEATLLETARGRWFLAEHGRRARRLDSAILEEAIARLQSSLREPPALLGQLRAEVETLSQSVAEMRASLLARASSATVSLAETAGGSAPMSHDILKAAEDMHEIAWSLQANEIDPIACEAMARHASRIYAMSRRQADESKRVLELSSALEGVGQRIGGLLDTILHELVVDDGDSPPAPPVEPSAPDA